ncbi:MAG: DJ-1 family glyoxalase III [Planctomycetota bacterium]
MADPETILVPLAEGFEEIEAVTIIDVLRRAELPVRVVGLAPGPVRGAHGITVGTDGTLDGVDPASLRAIVLPGGMPGTTNLLADERVLFLVRALAASGRCVAAICAAPLVLAAAGVLGNGPVTSHPSVRARLHPARVVDAPRVVRAGSLVTSQGPGTALEFALALVADWRGPSAAAALATAMLARGVD